MAFRVGQKVVCVDAPPDHGGYPERYPSLPKQGRIYTVRGFRSESSLWLREVVNPICPDGLESGFYIKRFRPVQERKQSTETGMAVLRGLLKTEKIPETTTSEVNRAVHQYSSTEQGA